MKKFYLSAIVFCLLQTAFAQVPNQFNYQAVARTTQGQSIPNALINTKFTILDGSASGTNVYSEVRLLRTNQLGLFTAAIGGNGATTVTGNFSTIDWSTGKKFIKVDVDPLGGTNFLSIGNTEMLSVPYALYAVNGKIGPTGPPNILTVGTVITGATGTPATASISGNSPTQTLNLLLPAGAQGSQGIQGLVGATGAVGGQGAQGPQGLQGLKSLVKTSVEPSGANCTAGGNKIETGIDTNGNNILEAAEVTGTAYACNGDVNNTWKTTGNLGTNPSNNFLGTTDNNAFVMKTNNIERLRLGNSGNVGINNINPLTILHVNGSSIIANAQIIDPDISVNSVIAGGVDDGNGWKVQSGVGGKSNFANGGNTWGMGVSSGDLIIGSGNGVSDNNLQTAIKIKSNRDVELVPTNGNVVIGTGTPKAKFTVKGTVSMPIKLIINNNYIINPNEADYQIVMSISSDKTLQLFCFLPTPSASLEGRIYRITGIDLPYLSNAEYNTGFGYITVVGDFLLSTGLNVNRPHLVISQFISKTNITVQCVANKWLIVDQNMWLDL